MNEDLLMATNALTLAHGLVLRHLKSLPANDSRRAKVQLLELQLDYLTECSRVVAGLNPDGSFDQVPRKTNGAGAQRKTPPTLPKKGGA